ncbi:FHA domain-containing protein [Parafrankia irregularis]|uniref:FHA domain-containing protein n=1 Tax=Parafrankia irregularis TaxID=795642 RepID=A0A0S4QQC0_9ACTN|nr:MULTISPECIES: FHA domain-containing protein [Parafrankia]MBE3205993.1 FHA domain-containing protein [Parafrankia sp. CH37]CUU57128.1 FHA domain-containing protein [Parafrankia irregularis]
MPDAPATLRHPRCPVCGTTRQQEEPFCLGCRFEFATGNPPRPPRPPQPPRLVPFRRRRWELHIEADRGYYDSLRQDPVFPTPPPPIHVAPLRAAVVVLGSRPSSRFRTQGVDLVKPPPDPGMSASHAQLDLQYDGRYLLHDLGSLNGIRLQPGHPRLGREESVWLRDGDQFFLGSWTRVTVRHSWDPPAPPSPEGSERPTRA